MSPHPGQFFDSEGMFVPQTLHFQLFSGDEDVGFVSIF